MITALMSIGSTLPPSAFGQLYTTQLTKIKREIAFESNCFYVIQAMQLCAKGGIIVVFGCAGSHMGVEIFPEMIFRLVKCRDLSRDDFQVSEV
jgi:hypothetical protein